MHRDKQCNQQAMWSRLTFRLLFHDYGKMVDGLMRSSHNPEQSHNQYIKTKPHTKSKLPHHQSSPLKQFFYTSRLTPRFSLATIIAANNITIATLEHSMEYQSPVIMQYPQHYQYQDQHPAAAADDMHIITAAAALLSSIQTQQPPIKTKKRRVTFKPTITVQPVCNLSKDTEQKSRLYYTKKDFETEKTSIRRIAKDAMTAPSSSHCLSNPTLRGMEMYLCRPRVQNKHLARKAFLQYQHNINANTSMSSEEKQLRIAAASSKLSQWSRLVAIETARQDSYAAYGKDYLIPIDNNSVDIPPFPTLLSTTDSKRRRGSRRVTIEEDDVSAADSQASNKRRRF